MRPSHVVAICRTALALALIIVIWRTPSYAAVASEVSFGWPVLVVYLLFTLVMLWLAWTHWWLSHHLRRWAFLTDAVIAFGLLYTLEKGDGGPVGPFMAFFVYLAMVATLLWPPRVALRVIAGLILAYLVIGLAMSLQFAGWDASWYLRRFGFMLVIGALIFWFGAERPSETADRLEWVGGSDWDAQLEATARFIRDHIPCDGLIVAWAPEDEPWVAELRDGSLGQGVSKLPPFGHLEHAPLVNAPLLFDAPRNRGLQLFEGKKVRAVQNLASYRLDSDFVPGTGITVGIESAGGAGWIVLTGIPGLSSDHLRIVAKLADEISRAINHHELVDSLRRNDNTRLRLAVARNLHDGVVQSLAGVRFRLESIRNGATAGEPIVDELAQLQRALASEETRVGRFIAELRQTRDSGHALRSIDHLSGVFTQVTDLWGIAGEFSADGDCEALPELLQQEIEPIVREAVSNAVRHGKATCVRCALRRDGPVLHLELADNGVGIQEQGESQSPRSILARVNALGGTLATIMHDGGTRIAIALPMEAAR